MNETRKDLKGRKLHNGEIQLSDGRYRYKYYDPMGKQHFVYSWRLDQNDPVPAGKRKCEALRQMEKRIEQDSIDHINSSGGNMTVAELVERYVETRTSVRQSTRMGYRTVIRFLQQDAFGKRSIDSVRVSDAKYWIIKLQQKDGKGYSSVCTIRGVVKPAFQMAVDDDILRKNPFSFGLAEVVINNSVIREAISREEERKYLAFIESDKHFSRYYEGIYILFKTGLRISEFCGLTISDIDFEEHCIRVERQLQKITGIGYHIEDTKTTNGERTLPLTKDVEECFRRIIEKRESPGREPVVDGVKGFLYLDKNGAPMYSLHWEKYFQHSVEKYNSIYKVQLPKITPHVCRHTYCSNMAKSGMNPKTLQYLMGHGDITITLNHYTHVRYEDAKDEIARLNLG